LTPRTQKRCLHGHPHQSGRNRTITAPLVIVVEGTPMLSPSLASALGVSYSDWP
jgi:hypothetical protein